MVIVYSITFVDFDSTCGRMWKLKDIEILENFGIRGNAFDEIKNLISQSISAVCYEGATSNIR